MAAWRPPRFLLLFLAFLFCFLGVRAYFFLTDDFRIGNIAHPFPPNEEWQVAHLLSKEELRAIVSQPFHYLGKGAQCYAFCSEDGNYIIKFFKFKHLRPRYFWKLIPEIAPFSRWKESEKERKRQRMHNVFSGYKLAYEQFPDLSQIVFMQINPSKQHLGNCTVTDKMGRVWQIPLDRTPFLVQKKGNILRSVIANNLEKGNTEGAKEALEKIFFMYLSEYRQGAYDRDHGIMHNTGFVGDQPFHLDVGKFCLCEPMRNTEVFQKDLSFVLWKMRSWLQDHYPKETPQLMDHLTQLFEAETGSELHLDSINPRDFQRKRKR